MNFIFVSPNFPRHYWKFCDRLHRNGVNVLGIGDTEYYTLEPELKKALTEYYRVDSMENYDEMFRAVAFFSFKYGKIDWIESNNEHWLPVDARLRTDFNINTGIQQDEVNRYRSKDAMKRYYAEAGIPAPRHIVVTDLPAAEAFAEKVGYPIMAKPNIGLWSKYSGKIENKKMLERFFEHELDQTYVMEEYVEGDICSYDAIINSCGEPLFESQTVWPALLRIVNDREDPSYYVTSRIPKKLRDAGRAAIKAFGVKSRFGHREFFCLTEAKAGLGKAGDFVGLKVNMRPGEGVTPDMINFAHATDVYQIYADMIVLDSNAVNDPRKSQYCVYAARRDRFHYMHSHDEIMEKYGRRIRMAERVPDIMAPSMGNQMYTACVSTMKELKQFVQYVQKKQ